MDEQGQSTNRPYPPPSNVIDVLQRLRSRNLPERVDNEYLRDAGIPEGSIGRTMFAFRFLGLLDEDLPTTALRSMVTSTDEEYREILGGLIRDRYREVFNVVDPSEDSQDRIVNVFRRYTPASQRDRMVTFFLGMCREAGIPVRDAPRQRASGVSSGRPNAQKSTAKKNGSYTPRLRLTTQELRGSGGDSGSDLPAALMLLVRSLPPEGTPMTDVRRNQWLDMAKAALAFIYPPDAPRHAARQDDEGVNEEAEG